MSEDDTRREHFTALYRRYHAAILAYALRRVDPDCAQDVVAETFAAAWRDLTNLPPDPAPWLYRTASFRIANERRSHTRQARVAARAAAQRDHTVPDHAPRVLDCLRVRHALSQLRDTDREALLLTNWEDLSHADAAFVLGCSTTALKVRLLRARRRLARALATSADTPPATQTPLGTTRPTSQSQPTARAR